MAWVPVADSGVAVVFNGTRCTMVGSVISCAGETDPSFGLGFVVPDTIRARLTWQSYTAGSEFGDVGGARLDFGVDEFTNEAFDANPQTAFTPGQMEADTSFIQYSASFGVEWGGTETWSLLVEVEQSSAAISYNCACDDTHGNKTLAELRADMMRRLGWGAMVAAPPPGVTDMLNSFLQGAQEALYRRYDVLRTERFFSWPLEVGVRLYDLPDNAEECTKKLDPRKVTWVGIERDGIWQRLICGIPPELYSGEQQGRPERYEIRQCIEVWPVPEESLGSLVIKGHFGLESFTEDTDHTTIDSELVFLLALANAKAHYRQPDANNYVQQLETMMQNLVAGSHHTRRYIPGRDDRADMIYTAPKPTVPFP